MKQYKIASSIDEDNDGNDEDNDNEFASNKTYRSVLHSYKLYVSPLKISKCFFITLSQEIFTI